MRRRHHRDRPVPAVERTRVQPAVPGRKPVAQITAAKPCRSSSVGTWVEHGRTRLDRGTDEIGHVVLVYPFVDAA